MQLRITNIGPIGSAEIDLTGLTVIGGLNDTGKSTIGKSLFALVKAIRNIEDEFAAGQRNKLTPIISELVTELRGVAGPNASPSITNTLLRRLRDVRRFGGDDGLEFFDSYTAGLKESILEGIEQRSALVYKRVTRGKITPQLDSQIEGIKQASIKVLDTYFARIREIIAEKHDPKAVYSASFTNMLSSIFREEINNKRRPSTKGVFQFSDNGVDLISATFRKNLLSEKDLKIDDNATSVLFEDATLIESPFILNFEDDLFITPRSNSGEYSGSYSTYDLLEKLNIASREIEPTTPCDAEIAEKISNTIKGRMYYDPEDDTFFFASDDNISVKIPNTASGVKTLGILQMLARAGVLTTSNLLIIDEPEVHLHPAWQILYAEIVAILVKSNVYCVVSSHSPYFIQALETYTKIYKIENLTKFYVSKKEAGVCSFEEVTGDLEPLYDLLAEPMEKIAYLQTRNPKP